MKISEIIKDKYKLRIPPIVYYDLLADVVEAEEEKEPKKCKDCKWWRDSDGAYRRGVGAESRCPINTVSVANGWGYCYMFESQESEDKE